MATADSHAGSGQPAGRDAAGWVSRLGKVRHDLRSPLGEILGFCDVLRDEAVERGLESLLPGLQSIHQMASRIFVEVNHRLSPETLPDQLPQLQTFGQTVQELAGQVQLAAEELSDRCDDLGDSAFGDDLLRIAGSARALGELTPRVLALLMAPAEASTAPAPTPESSEDTSAEARSAAEGGSLSGTILVVDDSEANRALLARRLRRQGFTVALAENGRQALDKLRTRRFDLLLLDILMPEMDGFEVLRRVKADPQTHNIPVILLSAVDELDAVVRGIELGAEDYLPKPFPAALLQARVRACLVNKRMSDQLRKYTAWLFGRTLFSQAVTAPESLSLRAQNRSILFADLRGFVEWSERRSPEEVVSMLNRYFEAAEKVLVASPVIKTEYTGDEIMAVFADGAEAVRVAVALRSALSELLEPLGLAVGMGLHAGPVTEGLVGGPDVKEYCFVGDTVNTANRVCKLAGGGQILVSRTLSVQLTPGTPVGEPVRLQIKGKTAPFEVVPLEA